MGNIIKKRKTKETESGYNRQKKINCSPHQIHVCFSKCVQDTNTLQHLTILMAARNRRRNNKKKSLLSKSGVQENDATYLFLAEELHENITDLNMGSEEAPIEARENSIPAKEFKHLQKQALQKLEPIDEHEDGDDEFSLKLKSVTKCSGPITEADVQKLLLSYAFTSGLIQEDETKTKTNRAANSLQHRPHLVLRCPPIFMLSSKDARSFSIT
ncbi:YMR147W-like protein [Saccharomyces cerevisiae x Saccharomyces kudriavzevii VIN7]|uniref:YMR147W-like protein n=1 Tax=Saccharomyces cerevisiae x Saccharomyces kudriavzevii (strain VIN7) TaxID=1095631 RepID=H0GZF1_SACCK|nr:YMR147W-like protein [Saccharomyces cerevisiae x Saccharomyces kudriavzevii VIN7]